MNKKSTQKIMTLCNVAKIGQKIRTLLTKNVVLSIAGPLGSGKTTLIKHILPEYEVKSPSFLHILLYGNDFAHIDAYTIQSKEAFFALNIEEMLLTRCVIIEWGNLLEKEIRIFDARYINIAISVQNNNHVILSSDEL